MAFVKLAVSTTKQPPLLFETQPHSGIYKENGRIVNSGPDTTEGRLLAGDRTQFDVAFSHHRPRLWQIIHFRLSDQIRARVDPDDIVQEVYLDARKRLDHFLQGSFPSFFLWLRLVAGQTLSHVHRTHISTESRSVARESAAATAWGSTSLCLSQRFVAHLTSPSQAASRQELIAEVHTALCGMPDTDREVLALRHFEELTNQEVAAELKISTKAASIRYVRALERLRHVLEKL